MKVLTVLAKSNIEFIANEIIRLIKEGEKVQLVAPTALAVNRAVQATIIARKKLFIWHGIEILFDLYSELKVMNYETKKQLV